MCAPDADFQLWGLFGTPQTLPTTPTRAANTELYPRSSFVCVYGQCVMQWGMLKAGKIAFQSKLVRTCPRGSTNRIVLKNAEFFRTDGRAQTNPDVPLSLKLWVVCL